MSFVEHFARWWSLAYRKLEVSSKVSHTISADDGKANSLLVEHAEGNCSEQNGNAVVATGAITDGVISTGQSIGSLRERPPLGIGTDQAKSGADTSLAVAQETSKDSAGPPEIGNPALEKAANQISQIKGILRKVQKDINTYIKEPELEAKLGIADLSTLVETIRDQIQRGESRGSPGDDDGSEISGMQNLPAVETVLVDTTEQVSELITIINEASAARQGSPTFYFDCEGENLGRGGTVTLLSIFVPQYLRAYVVDLQQLGDTAFMVEKDGTRLKAVLESTDIMKGIFDCRGDSDALFAHHGISLAGIIDVQLMEAATRKNSKRLFGLDVCIKNRLKDFDPDAKAKFSELKNQVKELMRSETTSCFAQRPLPDLLIEYAAQDVVALPVLYDHFLKHESYWGEWPSRVDEETRKRLELSRDANYDPSTLDMRAGPDAWIKMSRASKP